MSRKAGPRFPAGARDFSLLYSVQTGSGSQIAPYPMGTGAFSTEVKQADVKLTTHLNLVPRSRMMQLYLHSFTRLDGEVLNKLSTKTILLYFYLYRPHNVGFI
jgi:hypothetical protein